MWTTEGLFLLVAIKQRKMITVKQTMHINGGRMPNSPISFKGTDDKYHKMNDKLIRTNIWRDET